MNRELMTPQSDRRELTVSNRIQTREPVRGRIATSAHERFDDDTWDRERLDSVAGCEFVDDRIHARD
jgi:hypothetical protein